MALSLRYKLSRRASHSLDERPWLASVRTLGAGPVLGAAFMVLIWGGVATQTLGAVVSEGISAFTQLGHSNNVTTYSLFSTHRLSPQQVLDAYRAAALSQNAHTPGSFYLPLSTVERYPTPLDNERSLPVTGIGQLFGHLGLSPAALNTAFRQGAAKDEQLFLAAGLAAIVLSRRLHRRVSHELVFLCIGSIVMVGLFTVFPAFSVDYGVLRAFQESLILTAPLLALGSIVLFLPFGYRWSRRLAGGVCLGFFISTTGLMPQLLGGYPAQLSLNNSGQYYDVYYVHPQDVAAVNWLANKPGLIPTGLQASEGPFTSSMFAFNSLSDVNGRQFVADLYPALIQRHSWVLLNYSIVHTDRAPLSSQGELLTYAYPMQLLQSNKNLVYNNGGAEIYK